MNDVLRKKTQETASQLFGKGVKMDPPYLTWKAFRRHRVGPRQPTDIKWITTKKQVFSCPISHFLTPKNEIYKIAP